MESNRIFGSSSCANGRAHYPLFARALEHYVHTSDERRHLLRGGGGEEGLLALRRECPSAFPAHCGEEIDRNGDVGVGPLEALRELRRMDGEVDGWMREGDEAQMELWTAENEADFSGGKVRVCGSEYAIVGV